MDWKGAFFVTFKPPTNEVMTKRVNLPSEAAEVFE